MHDYFSQMLATLEVGPKSNLVIYEMVPTRRRKAIPVQVSMQQQNEAVSMAFSADGKLLAVLMPEPPPIPSSAPASASSTRQAGSPQLSYCITVYLWRTGKTLASISLGSSSLPTISPQVRND